MDVSVALDAGLLSSFDPASQRYECVACPKVGYGDVIPHLCSSQHRNSAAWDTIQSGMPNEAMLSILSDIIREAKIQDEIEAVDKKVFSYQCKICPGKRPFNGLAPLESHLCGGDHGKNKVRLGLIRSHPSSNSKSPRIQQNSPERDYQIFATPKHPRPSPSSTNQMRHNVQRGVDSRLGNLPPSSISGRGVRSKHSPYRPTRTSTSDTFSDSLEPPPSAYRASSGEANSPKSPSSYGYLFLTPGAKDALDSSTVVEREKTGSWTSYFCKACSVPLTGAKPLIQHIESSKHIKKVNGFNNMFFQPTANTSGPSNDNSGPLMQDFAYPNLLSAAANEAITSGVVEDRGGSYFCRVCNVPLTGPMPLNQHADSEKHRKKATMSTQLTASMSRLSINPYDGFHVSPPRPKVEHVSDSRILDPQELERQGRQPSDELDGRLYFKWNVISTSPMLPSEKIYCNISLPRGVVVIFNYLFTGTPNERYGAKRDSQNLEILFNTMGYKVWLNEECSMEETVSKLKEIQINPELQDINSFICIILSHGSSDSSFHTTTEEVDFDEVRYYFTNSACPQLRNKPKIFLSNFCRGQIIEKIIKVEHDFIPADREHEAPQDMITIYSSIKNFSAVRDRKEGTIFVKALCQVLSESACDTELSGLYRKLCIVMQNLEGTTPEQQVYNFKKDFYFNPINIENLTNI